MNVDDFVEVGEHKIILSVVVSITSSNDNIYSSDLMKGLGRTRQSSGIMAHVIEPKVSVSLSKDWKLLSPAQNLNRFGQPTRLRSNAESLKYFVEILSRHSPYCSWSVYDNYVKKPESRKEGCVYFRARAKCNIKDCKHNAILTIGSPYSKRLQIFFKEDMVHKKGNLAANSVIFRNPL